MHAVIESVKLDRLAQRLTISHHQPATMNWSQDPVQYLREERAQQMPGMLSDLGIIITTDKYSANCVSNLHLQYKFCSATTQQISTKRVSSLILRDAVSV